MSTALNVLFLCCFALLISRTTSPTPKEQPTTEATPKTTKELDTKQSSKQ